MKSAQKWYLGQQKVTCYLIPEITKSGHFTNQDTSFCSSHVPGGGFEGATQLVHTGRVESTVILVQVLNGRHLLRIYPPSK